MSTTTASFELLREQPIPEIASQARLYRHTRTGAEVLSLENDDENKVFGITFRTPPADSTGVAHILEHSVLCGSRKYPLKEPFVELLKGSLKTFLNAFTFPDKTCYPVASQNTQDFYNLIDVYLDAVFHPRLTPDIFAQEGWHYELEKPDAPLIYKGVVFNEMKGAYGSPDRLLGELAQQSLFPDTTYGVDAGGHPQAILDLTYDQLKQFHQTLYHPSNARIFFYGDDDPQQRLRIIDEYLNEFEPLDPESAVTLQTPFSDPRRIVQPFRVDQDNPESQQSRMTVNWLLPETDDPQQVLAFTILDYILVGTAASPLRKALLDSGLGEDLAASGFSSDLRQGMFSAGLKGINFDDADKVEALILDTLSSLAEQGIDPATTEAAVNTIEFALRENNTGSFPRGLVAMLRALTTWLHDKDPFTMLSFEAPLAELKARLERGEPIFEGLIRAHLLDNHHRTTTILQPDPALGQREAATEQSRLDAARAAMNDADIQAVVENTHRLRALQVEPDPPEALAKIPGVTLADLERENRTTPRAELEQQGARVLFHDLPTSGITYLRVGLDMHTLPAELLPYASIFARALFQVGTEHEDYVQLAQRIGRKTGGISAHKLVTTLRDTGAATAWLVLSGKATQDQNADLLAIMQEVLLTVKLDNRERLRQIVLEAKARREASIIPGGHGIVNLRLRACFNEADWAEEQMGGISYLFFLRRLVKEIDQDWPGVLAKLEQVRQTLLNRAAMLCDVTLDADNWQAFRPQLDAFLAALPVTAAAPVAWSPAYDQGFEGLTIPSQVNYVGKGANLYDLGYRYHGSAAAITKYLRTTWLWERIRVQGGAYGAFDSFERRSGVFTFLSYRDPNLENTLDVYDQAGQFLRQADLDDKAVERSIIGAISDIDSYQLPDARGYTSMVRYLVGDTDADMQRIREEVLATTAADFRAFADVLDQVRDTGLVVVLGAGEAIERLNANPERPDLRRVDVL